MPETISTLGELREETGGVITIESHESNDSHAAIEEFNSVIWTAHHRPPAHQPLPLTGLSKDWDSLQEFYSTAIGAAFRNIGNILGDVGATEISHSIFKRLNGVKGIKPLWIYPSLGGRVGIDWNRIPGMAAADIPRLPDGIHNEHVRMHGVGIKALEKILTGISPGAKLILQPHTMSSGEFGDDAETIVAGGKALNPDLENYTEKILDMVGAFREMYNNGCNNGPQRPDIDLITGYRDTTLPPIPDGGFTDHFEARLREAGISPERNKPFANAPGYPGTVLIENLQKRRRELGLRPTAHGLFDAAKRLLQTGGHFDALDFVVSAEGVERIAQAVELAVKDTL